MTIDKLIEEAAPAMRAALFSWIQPDAEYFVFGDRASTFINKRLLMGAPILIVGKDGKPNKQPVRDYTIYRLDETGAGTNTLDAGWVEFLEADGYGKKKLGADITVEEIWASAMIDVLCRLEELGHDVPNI